jgi:aryl-alcohol dehydrogenase-like predicted oxidoreductase
MVNKIALGTVQFGIDYGINNSSGQVGEGEVQEILRYCVQNNIDTLDTAYAYGNSEIILGKLGVERFKIISKLPACETEDVHYYFEKSMHRLKREQIYAYLLHNFSIYKRDKSIWGKLSKLKEDKKVLKIGISLYSPAELTELWDDGISLDIVQIPYNLFDRRFEELFPLIKSQNIEIHTRSTFLQGLFFKTLDSLPKHFETIKPKICQLHEISTKKGMSVNEICLAFVLKNEFIDTVVIGVDSLNQLEANVKTLQKIELSEFNSMEFDFLQEEDINIINPSLWKP